MRRVGYLVAIGMLIGIITTTQINNRIAEAQVIQSWSRDEVTAVLLVKPSFDLFVPAEGNSIGLTWNKDQVIPVCLTKPSIGGFVPLEGTTIGNTWSKSDVKPVVFVEPYLGTFVLSISGPDTTQSPVPAPAHAPALNAPRRIACNPAIETHIVGDFNGWEGETLYKMDDGSIWQQSNYHYHYHYAYHPAVTIFPSSSGACHILVEGDSDDGVDVVRIK